MSRDKLVSAAGLVWDVTVRFGQPEYIDEREKPLLGINQTILRAGQRLSTYKEALPEELKYLTGLSIQFQWPAEG